MTLRAIRHGEVDALVVGAVAGEKRLFTLSSADRTYPQLVGTPFVDLVLTSSRDRLSEVTGSASPAGSVEAVLVGPTETTVPVRFGVSSLLVGATRSPVSRLRTSPVNVRSRRTSRDNALVHAQQRTFSEALHYSRLTDTPQSYELQIAVRYQPATQDVQVGGDWYDAVVTPSGETVIVIGDVVGHDTQATVMMAQLRGSPP